MQIINAFVNKHSNAVCMYMQSVSNVYS